MVGFRLCLGFFAFVAQLSTAIYLFLQMLLCTYLSALLYQVEKWSLFWHFLMFLQQTSGIASIFFLQEFLDLSFGVHAYMISICFLRLTSGLSFELAQFLQILPL